MCYVIWLEANASIQNNSGLSQGLRRPLVAGWACGIPTGGGSPHARHETPRVHHAARRRGGGVAARGACATAADAADWFSQCRFWPVNARRTASVASPWMRSHAACALRPRAVNCEKNGKLVRANSTSIRSSSILGRSLRSAAMRRTRTDNKRRRRSLRSRTLAPNSRSLAPAACNGPSASRRPAPQRPTRHIFKISAAARTRQRRANVSPS
jgi:hypothetical protein